MYDVEQINVHNGEHDFKQISRVQTKLDCYKLIREQMVDEDTTYRLLDVLLNNESVVFETIRGEHQLAWFKDRYIDNDKPKYYAKYYGGLVRNE